MNRKRLILFVLLVVLAGTVLWSYISIPRYKTVNDLPSVTTKKSVKKSKTEVVSSPEETDDGTRLKIDMLTKKPVEFKGYRRNIFKSLFAEEQKQPEKKTVQAKPAVVKREPSAAVLPIVVQPEAAPLARFTFLGFLKKGSVKTVFLAKDKDILLVKKGDKVALRYEATEISDKSLTLTVTDTGDEIIIPLVENKPLLTPR
ncbi:MAG: type II secretion system protein PulP [Desulfuromonadaceae bacterium]|nr:type II secretion system protein PulP [Desulfuromonadaceae bacterium]MDD2854513.1 type II secretion system protein PulP [Desulfuromonadaceae bacterium]